MEARCRHRLTSVEGEILATAAQAQRAAGDALGSLSTYNDAVLSFKNLPAPLPPEVACGRAAVALSIAEDSDQREKAAQHAHECFRKSLPSDPTRVETIVALSRLRHDGLATAAFDAPDAPNRYFSKKPALPTVDAIEVEILIPDASMLGSDSIRKSLMWPHARTAVADCFVKRWSKTHEHFATAELILSFSTTPVPRGSLETYDSRITTETIGTVTDFSKCVGSRLPGAITAPPRLHTLVSWQQPFDVIARLR